MTPDPLNDHAQPDRQAIIAAALPPISPSCNSIGVAAQPCPCGHCDGFTFAMCTNLRRLAPNNPKAKSWLRAAFGLS